MVESINSSGLRQGVLEGLNQSRDKQETALERIGSGKQVNSAADNAAGLAIIERFASQIDGFSQAVKNASDGVSFTQVAEATLSTVGEDLQRIRELSIQAANGSLSDNDRGNLQAEVSQLQEEVGRRINEANFNGVDLFTSGSEISFQVGANANETVELTTTDITSDINEVSSIDISTQVGAQNAVSVVDEALQTFSNQQAEYGALNNRLESSINTLQNNQVNTQDARGRIEDADLAKETGELIRGQIQQQSGIAVQSQANSSARLVLQLLS